jgi:hypothetical protein
MRVGLCVALLLAIAIHHSQATRAEAADAAAGVYLLGSSAVGAGITPPPGFYFQDDTCFHGRRIGGGTAKPIETNL